MSEVYVLQLPYVISYDEEEIDKNKTYIIRRGKTISVLTRGIITGLITQYRECVVLQNLAYNWRVTSK